MLLSYKKEETLTHAIVWEEPSNTLPSEGSQTQKGTHIVHFHLYEISRTDKSVETEADWRLPGSEGREYTK